MDEEEMKKGKPKKVIKERRNRSRRKVVQLNEAEEENWIVKGMRLIR